MSIEDCIGYKCGLSRLEPRQNENNIILHMVTAVVRLIKIQISVYFGVPTLY